MIEGLSHMTFIARDLERARIFWETVFDAHEIYRSEDRTFSVSREKFFLVGDIWIAVMEGEPSPARDYGHVAFKIDEAAYNDYVEKIQSLGLNVEPDRPRVKGEGWSIYFRDFDGHRFELHTGTLEERLRHYATLSG